MTVLGMCGRSSDSYLDGSVGGNGTRDRRPDLSVGGTGDDRGRT